MFLSKTISIVFAAVLIPYMIYAEEVPEPSDLVSVDCMQEEKDGISQEDLQNPQTNSELSASAGCSPVDDSSVDQSISQASIEPRNGQTAAPAAQETPLPEAQETEIPLIPEDRPVAETADDSAILESTESEENTDDLEIEVTSDEEPVLSEQAAPQQGSDFDLPVSDSDTSMETENREPGEDLPATLSDTELDEDVPDVTEEVDPASSQVEAHTETEERIEHQTTKDLSKLLSSVRLCGEGIQTSADQWQIPNGTVCELSLIFKENDSLYFAPGLLEYRLPGNFIPFADDINSICGTASNQAGNLSVTVDTNGSVQVNWDTESAEPDILTVLIKGTWKPVATNFSFGNGISKRIEIVELFTETNEDKTAGNLLSTDPESMPLSSKDFTPEYTEMPTGPALLEPDIPQDFYITEEEEEKRDEDNSKTGQGGLATDECADEQTSVSSQMEYVPQSPAIIMDNAVREMTPSEDQNGIEVERVANTEETDDLPQELPTITYEYQELTVEIPCFDNTTASLSLSGNLPVNAKLVITPAELSIPGQTVYAAFDLKIHDGYGNEYMPDVQSVQTSIFIPTSDNGARTSPERFHLYHIQDEAGGMQLISFDNEDSHTLHFNWPVQ